MVNASSTSTPLTHLCLRFSLLSSISLLCRILHGLIPLTSPSSPFCLLFLPKSGLFPVASLFCPTLFGLAAVGNVWKCIRWRSSSPVSVEAFLPPVRAGPQQSSLHEPAHHHICEVVTEILEIHPEDINKKINKLVECKFYKLHFTLVPGKTVPELPNVPNKKTHLLSLCTTHF